MKIPHMIVLSAVLWVSQVPMFGQSQADNVNARQLVVFDRQGMVVNRIEERGLYSQPAFSSDLKRLAVVKADPQTQNQDIWVFDLSTGESTQVTSAPAPESAPVWSPDGNQIAFVSNRGSWGLYRKASTGAGNEELLYREKGFGGLTLTDWSADGHFLTFLYAINISGALYRLPVNDGPGSGNPNEILRPNFNALGSRISPNGRFIAYSDRGEIYVRPLNASAGGGAQPVDGPWQVSTHGGSGMIFWRQDGMELYYLAADRGVMAVDVTTSSAFHAEPPRLLFRAPDTILSPGTPGLNGLASISRDGQRFVFAVPPSPPSRQITVFDRQGKVLRTAEPGPYYQPALSPDGARVAGIHHDLETGIDAIWVTDLSTGKSTPVTPDSAPAAAPVWSPDGSQIAYVSTRGDYAGIYRKAFNGSGNEELLYRHTPGTALVLTDWSADGRFLSFYAGDVLYALPLNGDRKAIELERTVFSAIGGRLSSDNRFLAYLSNESGRYEVVVRPFDSASAAWQVSSQGAQGMISWRQDSKELYYLAADGAVMAVEITTTPEFQSGTPRILFHPPDIGSGSPYGVLLNPPQLRNVSRDGQRFVFSVQAPASAPQR